MKPFGRPVGHREAAARPQHAHHLVRRALLVGREHGAEGGEHDVERAVGVGKRLDVGFLEVHGEPLGAGALAALVEQGRDVVGRGDAGEPARRGERGVAVAGGHVEDVVSGAHVGRLGERLADDLQGGADDRVVAAGPGGLLALLDGGEVGVATGLSTAMLMAVSFGVGESEGEPYAGGRSATVPPMGEELPSPPTPLPRERGESCGPLPRESENISP